MFQRFPSQTSSRGWRSENGPSLALEQLAGFCTDVLPVNQSLRFFSVLFMPAETWTSCHTSPKSPEGLFGFEAFTLEGRGIRWPRRGEERSRDRLKGKRGRAHREAPWLSSGPRLSRQGREISARRARGTNLLRHNRSVHKQTPLDGRATTLKDLSLE